MKKKLVLLIVGIFISIGVVNAQVMDVSGVVVSKKDGAPIIGASVALEGTSISAITDLDGKFLIKDVPASVKIMTIRSIGMKTVKVAVGSDMVVKMQTGGNFPYGKNSVHIGWNEWNPDNNSLITLNGFSLGYSHKFELSKTKNFFLEVGALLAVNKACISDVGHSYWRINVPISFGYMFNVGQSGFSISPKVGLILVANLRGMTETYQWEYKGAFGNTAHDCGYGVQAGLELAYKHFALNVSCALHDGEYMVNEGVVLDYPRELTVSLAYCF